MSEDDAPAEAPSEAARHRRLMELFGEGCDLAPPLQDELVAKLRAEDPALADRLAGMFTADRGPGLEPEPPPPDDPLALLGLMATTHPDGADPAHPPAVVDRRRLGELAHYARRVDVRRYELLDKLGEGGMGVVLRARQRQPDRAVAIKLLRAHSASDKLRKRFAAEGQVLARLSHKGIARVYEAVVDLPEPYIVMELVAGRPLHEVAPSLTLSARVALLADIAEAVDHAHKNGIVHRDLKPPNILVEADNNPKILDFGIARVVSGDTPVTTLTHAGELLGTPAYMSPEQITGGLIGPHTDVYALGVIAYEVLTDRLPYDLEGLDVFAAFQKIREHTPLPLGKVDRHLRGDLEVIVAKALEKDPAHRYGSAAAMAEDLRRVLAFEPIRARPPSTLYQLARFARRNRALSLAILALFLTLVTGVIVATRFYVAAEEARDALASRVDALILAQSRSLLSADPSGAAAILSELSDEAPWDAAFALAWDANGRARSTVVPGRGAPLEWVAQDPPWLALGGEDGTLRLVDTERGRVIDTAGHEGQVNHALFLRQHPALPDLPMGAHLVSAGDDSIIKLWSEDGALLHALAGHEGEVETLSLSACGLLSGGADGTLRRVTGAPPTLQTLAGARHPIKDIACSPDHRRVAAATEGSGVIVHDLGTGASRLLSDGAFDHLAFAPSGLLAAGGHRGRVVVWSPSLETLYELAPPADQQSDIKGLSFVPPDLRPGDSPSTAERHDLVAVDRGGILRRWRLPELTTHILARDGGIYRALALSPDHRFLATASDDRTVGLWDLASESRLVLRGHLGAVSHVAFGASSRELVSSSIDGTARRWSLPTTPRRWAARHPVALAAAPTGSGLAVGTLDGRVLGLDPSHPHLTGLTPHGDIVYGLAFSPDGRLLASSSRDLRVLVHEATGERRLVASFTTSHRALSVAFSPDGRALAAGLATSAVAAWDLASRAPLPLAPLPPDAGRAELVAWHQDRLVVGTHSGQLVAYAPRAHPGPGPAPPVVIDRFANPIRALTSQGPWLAAGSAAGEVRRYHSALDTPPELLTGEGAVVIALGPGGELVSGDHGGEVQALFGSGRHSRRSHASAVTTVTSDGTWVVSGGADRTVTLWRPADGRAQVIELFGSPLRRVLIHGAELFTLADEDDVLRWPLPLPSTREAVQGELLRF